MSAIFPMLPPIMQPRHCHKTPLVLDVPPITADPDQDMLLMLSAAFQRPRSEDGTKSCVASFTGSGTFKEKKTPPVFTHFGGTVFMMKRRCNQKGRLRGQPNVTIDHFESTQNIASTQSPLPSYVHQNGSVNGINGVGQRTTNHEHHQNKGQPPVASVGKVTSTQQRPSRVQSTPKPCCFERCGCEMRIYPLCPQNPSFFEKCLYPMA